MRSRHKGFGRCSYLVVEYSYVACGGRDACLIVVEHDEFLTLAYYNCESKIFNRWSVVPLTRTRRWPGVGATAAPVLRPDNTPAHGTHVPTYLRPLPRLVFTYLTILLSAYFIKKTLGYPAIQFAYASYSYLHRKHSVNVKTGIKYE